VTVPSALGGTFENDALWVWTSEAGGIPTQSEPTGTRALRKVVNLDQGGNCGKCINCAQVVIAGYVPICPAILLPPSPFPRITSFPPVMIIL
jgi:hypothetical protein